MNGAALGGLDRAGFVNRLADDVHDAAERAVADGHRNGASGVGDLLAAHEAFGRVHRDGAHGRFAQMLRHFQHQPVAVVVGFERVHDLGQFAFELHVDDGAHHLRDAADLVAHRPWRSHSFQAGRLDRDPVHAGFVNRCSFDRDRCATPRTRSANSCRTNSAIRIVPPSIAAPANSSLAVANDVFDGGLSS